MLVGIDFATGSGETWVARGEARDGTLRVHALERVSNGEIPPICEGGRVVGIDVPLGWPDAFQEAMKRHRADRPQRLPAEFPARLTDEHVRKHLGLTPLSVAADLIGRCAWQAAAILAGCPHRINPVEACVAPCVIEVYPKAVLRVLAGKVLFNELKRYKSGPGQVESRRRICEQVMRGRIVFEAYSETMLACHDALDAVLALYAAWAFDRGGVVFPTPEERERVSREGWIYYPGVFESAVEAMIAGDAAALGRALKEHPDLVKERSAREHRSTLLHYVSANGVEAFHQRTPPNIVGIARMLLDAGADVNAESEAYGGGSTTLGLTATSVHPEKAGVQIELMQLLLERGAKIHPGDAAACLANGRGAAAEFLASRGAPLDFAEAAGLGRLDLVQELVGTATAKQTIDGLGWACEYGRTEVVKFLLEQSLSREALDRGLHWAAYAGDPGIVKMLLARGAPVDEQDARFHATPLGWAMHARREGRTGHFAEVAAMLIAAGARPLE